MPSRGRVPSITRTRSARRAEPVRDDDQGAGPAPEGVLHAGLGGGVEVAGRLVQHHDPRGAEPDAGERDELPLPRRQAQRGGVGIGLGGVRAQVGEVLGERAAEDVRLLRDDRDGPAPPGGIGLGERHAADVGSNIAGSPDRPTARGAGGARAPGRSPATGPGRRAPRSRRGARPPAGYGSRSLRGRGRRPRLGHRGEAGGRVVEDGRGTRPLAGPAPGARRPVPELNVTSQPQERR